MSRVMLAVACPQLRLHRLDARALGDEQAGTGMPKVIEAQAVRQRGRAPVLRRLGDCLVRGKDSWLEAVPDEIGPTERPTQGGGEHQHLRTVRSSGEPGGDLLGNRPWHPHDARLWVFTGPPLQTTDLHRGLDHPSRAAKQIQPTDPERRPRSSARRAFPRRRTGLTPVVPGKLHPSGPVQLPQPSRPFSRAIFSRSQPGASARLGPLLRRQLLSPLGSERPDPR